MLKNTLIVIVVVVALIGGYYGATYFTSGAPPTGLTTSKGAVSGSTTVGKDFVRTLVNLESLKLDEKVFVSAIFKSLVDFSVELQPQPRGRNNPFSPLEREGSATSSSSARSR